MPHASSLIDVVIPVYNAAATLEAAIASIQRQTVSDIDIIIVDDGSIDRTPALLKEIAAHDRRVRIITKPNGGIVDALNCGLDHAGAEFVARFDADDIAFPDRLAKQVAFLQQNSRFVAVGGNVYHIGPDGVRSGTRSHFGGQVRPNPRAVPAEEPYLLHPFLLARRDSIVRVGGYRYVFHAEDTDLYWRLLRVGDLYNLPDLLGEYRRHPGSVSGASVLNGRVAAIYSQLAALSFLRMERSEPDLVFEEAMLQECYDQLHVNAMLSLWNAHLAPDEAQFMRIAVAAKLMELAAYRPYELEEDDCQFIFQSIVERAWRQPPRNILQIGIKWMKTVLRLYKSGRWSELRALTGLVCALRAAPDRASGI